MVDKLRQEPDPNRTAAREILQEVAERVLRNLGPDEQYAPFAPPKPETSST